MTNHRSIIEDIATEFEDHVNKGSLKKASLLLPELFRTLLDMVESRPSAPAPAETPPQLLSGKPVEPDKPILVEEVPANTDTPPEDAPGAADAEDKKPAKKKKPD